MQFILTRTFAISGLLVGAYAAPVPSFATRWNGRSLEVRESLDIPANFLVPITSVVFSEHISQEKREPWAPCAGGCMRSLPEDDHPEDPGTTTVDIAQVKEEKREPWVSCMGGCMRDLGEEDEVSPQSEVDKREPDPVPVPAPSPEPHPWTGACEGGCAKRESQDEEEVNKRGLFHVEAPLDIIARNDPQPV